jgi:hypothetical protein
MSKYVVYAPLGDGSYRRCQRTFDTPGDAFAYADSFVGRAQVWREYADGSSVRIR